MKLVILSLRVTFLHLCLLLRFVHLDSALIICEGHPSPQFLSHSVHSHNTFLYKSVYVK